MPGISRPDQQCQEPFESLEQPFGELDTDRFGFGAHLAHAQRDDQRQQRQGRLHRFAFRGQVPEQAREQDHVRDAVQHRVHERAGALRFPAMARDGPVEHVAQPTDQQQDAGDGPVAGHDLPPAQHDEHRRGRRELPRTNAGPDQERQDRAIGPGEDPLHEPARGALVLARRGHVADARRLTLGAFCVVVAWTCHGSIADGLSRCAVRTRPPSSGNCRRAPRRRPLGPRTRP